MKLSSSQRIGQVADIAAHDQAPSAYVRCGEKALAYVVVELVERRRPWRWA